MDKDFEDAQICIEWGPHGQLHRYKKNGCLCFCHLSHPIGN